MRVVASEMTSRGAGIHKSNAAMPSKTSGAITMIRQHDPRFRGGFEGVDSGVLIYVVYHDGDWNARRHQPQHRCTTPDNEARDFPCELNVPIANNPAFFGRVSWGTPVISTQICPCNETGFSLDSAGKWKFKDEFPHARRLYSYAVLYTETEISSHVFLVDGHRCRSPQRCVCDCSNAADCFVCQTPGRWQ